MKQILIPFYDSWKNPTQIWSYAVLNRRGDVDVYNNVDVPHTPQFRLPHKDIGDYLGEDLYIWDKKTFYKLYSGEFNNLTDVNSCYRHHMEEYIMLDTYKKPFNYIINEIRDSVDFKLLQPLSNNYNHLLRAEAILDGVVHIGGKRIEKTYDHNTTALRLRDYTGGTLSMRTELRDTVKTRGVLIEFDMESFHLRILNQLIAGNIPEDIRAHDYIVDKAGLRGEDSKKQIFGALYSENFRSVDCEFFFRLEQKYKRIKSPFGRTHDNFNYKVQEYESLLMSKYISKINIDYVDILFYLYDGLYLDLKDPNRLKDLITLMKNEINLPFTIKVGKLEKRFY